MRCLASLLCLTLPACKKQSGPLRIGIVNSVTGPEAPIGELLTNGYLLAQEDLKRAGICSDVEVRNLIVDPH